MAGPHPRGHPAAGDARTPDPGSPLGAALRRAVLDHVTSETRRVFPPVVHAGCPGAHVVDLALDGPRPDQALRTDVVTALVHRVAREGGASPTAAPLVWLTRPGGLEVQDDDLVWSAAAHAAVLELATRVVPLVVVTRQGWCDPRTGASRTWRRLRPRR